MGRGKRGAGARKLFLDYQGWGWLVGEGLLGWGLRDRNTDYDVENDLQQWSQEWNQVDDGSNGVEDVALRSGGEVYRFTGWLDDAGAGSHSAEAASDLCFHGDAVGVPHDYADDGSAELYRHWYLARFARHEVLELGVENYPDHNEAKEAGDDGIQQESEEARARARVFVTGLLQAEVVVVLRVRKSLEALPGGVASLGWLGVTLIAETLVVRILTVATLRWIIARKRII